MRTRIGLTIVLLLVAAPALAQKITIDYDHDFDFEKVKTFAYVETKETNSENSLILHQNLIHSIQQQQQQET